VVGDSAGGGLVMALLLRLRAAGEELPGSARARRQPRESWRENGKSRYT